MGDQDRNGQHSYHYSRQQGANHGTSCTSDGRSGSGGSASASAFGSSGGRGFGFSSSTGTGGGQCFSSGYGFASSNGGSVTSAARSTTSGGGRPGNRQENYVHVNDGTRSFTYSSSRGSGPHGV